MQLISAHHRIEIFLLPSIPTEPFHHQNLCQMMVKTQSGQEAFVSEMHLYGCKIFMKHALGLAHSRNDT